MRRIGVACALGVVLLVSACGGAPKTIALPKVPYPLRQFIRLWSTSFADGAITEIDVYGPRERAPLVKAAIGHDAEHRGKSDVKDKGKDFYLVVLHGNFVCSGCSGPHPLIPPHTKIEVAVWSPREGESDWAIMKTLQPGVKKLHWLAKVRVT